MWGRHNLVPKSQQLSSSFTTTTFFITTMPQCLAYGCKVTRGCLPEGVSFHRFPRDVKLCTVWVRRCGTDVGNISKFVSEEVQSTTPRHFLCSNHFEEDMFELDYRYELLPDNLKPRRPRRRLIETAVPTVFTFSKCKRRRSSLQQIEKRDRQKLVDELLTAPQPTLETFLKHIMRDPIQAKEKSRATTHNVEGDIIIQYVNVEVEQLYEEIIVDSIDMCTVDMPCISPLRNMECQTEVSKNACSIGTQTDGLLPYISVRKTSLKMKTDVATQCPDVDFCQYYGYVCN